MAYSSTCCSFTPSSRTCFIFTYTVSYIVCDYIYSIKIDSNEKLSVFALYE